jgi:hypothetical protein
MVTPVSVIDTEVCPWAIKKSAVKLARYGTRVLKKGYRSLR